MYSLNKSHGLVFRGWYIAW